MEMLPEPSTAKYELEVGLALIVNDSEPGAEPVETDAALTHDPEVHDAGVKMSTKPSVELRHSSPAFSSIASCSGGDGINSSGARGSPRTPTCPPPRRHQQHTAINSAL